MAVCSADTRAAAAPPLTRSPRWRLPILGHAVPPSRLLDSCLGVEAYQTSSNPTSALNHARIRQRIPYPYCAWAAEQPRSGGVATERELLRLAQETATVIVPPRGSS